MSETVQVITLLVSYALLFLAGMLAGYTHGLKKGFKVGSEWYQDEQK